MNEQLGTMINTQPAPQALPDQNAASLVVPQGMNAETAKATLGNATYLQSLLLPQKDGSGQENTGSGKPQDAPAEPKTAPGDAQAPKAEEKAESGMEERLMKQIDALKDQITGNRQQDELGRIREELTALLNEDGRQE